MNKLREHKSKKLNWLLGLALLAYVVKNIFVGADTDEGYGIMVGYRLAMGDRMLLEMWEPHQTSAIFTAAFIKVFLTITGGNVDFLNLYLRVVYFMVHGAVTASAYHTFRVCLPGVEKKLAAGLALVLFVCSPKSIFVPEYSNLHIWFLTLLVLSLMWYYCEASPLRGKMRMLTAAGVFLTCDVLAYPSMVLLLPVCMGFMVWQKRTHKKNAGFLAKECLLLLLPCVLGAAVFLGYVFSYMTPQQLLQVIPYILQDGSHQLEPGEKLVSWLGNMGLMAVQIVACGLLAWGIAFCYGKICCNKTYYGKISTGKHGQIRGDREVFGCLFLIVFFVLQIIFMFYTWFTHVYNAAYPRVIYFAIALTALYCYHKTGKKNKLGIGLIGLSAVNYVAVMLLSNWEPDLLAPYFVLGAMGGLLCWNDYFQEYGNQLQKNAVRVLCSVLVLSSCFGYCFRIIGGELTPSTIFEIRGLNRDGFRKGLLTSYMTAYRYNTDNEIWTDAIPAGSNLLYVGTSQFFYMQGDCVVATPNTISTPTYDESLLAYWEMNPDRYPDVVAIESWFGDVSVVEEDSFLIQWLEEKFQPTEVEEYPYVTVYRR